VRVRVESTLRAYGGSKNSSKYCERHALGLTGVLINSASGDDAAKTKICFPEEFSLPYTFLGEQMLRVHVEMVVRGAQDLNQSVETVATAECTIDDLVLGSYFDTSSTAESKGKDSFLSDPRVHLRALRVAMTPTEHWATYCGASHAAGDCFVTLSVERGETNTLDHFALAYLADARRRVRKDAMVFRLGLSASKESGFSSEASSTDAISIMAKCAGLYEDTGTYSNEAPLYRCTSNERYVLCRRPVSQIAPGIVSHVDPAMWCIVDKKTGQVMMQSKEILDIDKLWVTSPSDIMTWFRADGRGKISPLKGIQITLLTSGVNYARRTLAANNHAHVHELEESRRLAFELDWATAKWEHVGAALRSVSPLLLSTWREVGIKWNIGAAAVENFSAQLWSQFVPDEGIGAEMLQTWCDKRDRLLQRGGDLYDISVSSLEGVSLGEPKTDVNASKPNLELRRGAGAIVDSSAAVISFVESCVSGKDAKRLQASHVVVAVNGRSVASLSCSKITKLLQHSSFPIKLRLRDTSWKKRAPGERYLVKLPKHFHDTGICWGDSDLHPGLTGCILHGKFLY
jgi:hypothetical protein